MPKLPLIDLSFIENGYDDVSPQSIAEIERACRSNGFFQITRHGVSRGLQNDILEMAQKLYSLPLAQKNKLSLSLSTKKRGYSGLGQQQLDPSGAPDMKESFYISEDTPDSGNIYPIEEDVPHFRAVASKYYDEMIRLSQRIFRLLARALNLPPDTFDNYSGADGTLENTFGSTLRFVHYPPSKLHCSLDQPSCGAHTDFGTLTLLLQDGVSGLEVRDIATGAWFAVPAQPDMYVVNVGDLMEHWTSGYFKSAPHRVVFDAPVSRYSVPFFFNGNHNFTIRPFPAFFDQSSPNRVSEVITVGKHIKNRMHMTHVDLKTA